MQNVDSKVEVLKVIWLCIIFYEEIWIDHREENETESPYYL